MSAAHPSKLFTQYELLLGQYCQTRRGSLFVHLVRDVMPALTMSQEENECAKRYRELYPDQLTPFDEPRNLRYEEWKHSNCWRWYYYDHEREAERTLKRRLEEDPECRVSRVPTLAETFRVGVPLPEGVRPATMKWYGYAPPPLPGPLLGLEGYEAKAWHGVALFAAFGALGGWWGSKAGTAHFFKGQHAKNAALGAAVGAVAGIALIAVLNKMAEDIGKSIGTGLKPSQ